MGRGRGRCGGVGRKRERGRCGGVGRKRERERVFRIQKRALASFPCFLPLFAFTVAYRNGNRGGLGTRLGTSVGVSALHSSRSDQIFNWFRGYRNTL